MRDVLAQRLIAIAALVAAVSVAWWVLWVALFPGPTAKWTYSHYQGLQQRTDRSNGNVELLDLADGKWKPVYQYRQDLQARAGKSP